MLKTMDCQGRTFEKIPNLGSVRKGMSGFNQHALPRTRSFYILLCICLCIRINTAEEERLRFTRLSIDDGLPTNKITCIAQDSLGFLWFANNMRANSLVYYNGYEIARLAYPDTLIKRPRFLVSTLLLMRNGQLLIGTNEGLMVHNRAQDYLSPYAISDKHGKKYLENVHIRSLCEDKFGRLFIGTDKDGLFVYNAKEKTVEHFTESFMSSDTIKKTPQCYCITSLQMDWQDNLWIGAKNGVFKYSPRTRQLLNYNEFLKGLNLVLSKTITALLIDTKKRLWIGSSKGFTVLDLKSPQPRILPAAEPGFISDSSLNITAFAEDHDGNIWLGGVPNQSENDLLIKYDSDNQRFSRFSLNPYNENISPKNNINYLFCDRTGCLWIATQYDGILKLVSSKKFKHLDLYEKFPSIVRDINIQAICEDSRGYLWFGTRRAGFYCYDRKKNQIVDYNYLYVSPSVTYSTVYSIYEDRNHRLWIGSNHGLYLYNRQSRTLTEVYPQLPKPQPSIKTTVGTIYEDKDGIIWAGTFSQGLLKITPSSLTYELFPRLEKENMHAEEQKFNFINCIAEDNRGNLWLGSYSGLAIFDRQKKTYRVFSHDPTDPNSLPSDFVGSIYCDSRGTLWVGTLHGGIARYDYDRDCFENFPLIENKLSDYIYGIVEDSKYNLWLKTTLGIAKFNIQSSTFSNYTRQDGVTFHTQFYSLWTKNYMGQDIERITYPVRNFLPSNALCKTRDGTLWFGDVNCLDFFHPDSLVKSNSLANITLIRIAFQGNRKYQITRLYNGQTLPLKYYDNYFTISFTLLDYRAPEKNLYQYKLENLDDDWSKADNLNQAVYANVPPGRYTFLVRAANPDGLWQADSFALHFIITPPYWQTLWFKLIIFSSIAILILSIFFARLTSIRRQKNRLEVEVAQRTCDLQQKTLELQQAHARLEQKVIERTKELADANLELQKEISIRQQAEESLRTSEATARALLNAPTDLAFLLNAQGLILALNQAGLERIGKSAFEDVLGHSIFEYMEPEVAKLRWEKFTECVVNKIPIQFEDVHRNRNIAHSLYPTLGLNGEVEQIATFSRDITDQKIAEKVLKSYQSELEALVNEKTSELRRTNVHLIRQIRYRRATESKLRASELKFRDLFQNANDLIWIANAEGQFVSVNKHFKDTVGFSKRELLTMNPLNLVSPAFRFVLIRKYLKVIYKRESVGLETEITTKNGQKRIIWIKLRPVVHSDSRIEVHGIGRDVTELKIAQADLRKKEEEKRENLRQFTLKLAHEIKNPLASIKSSAQLVAASLAQSNPRIEKHMEVINRNVNICNQVIQDLYSFTQGDGYYMTEMEATAFFNRLLTNVKDTISAHPQITLISRIPAFLPKIYIDERRLSQALQNIVLNGLESINNKGMIYFTVTQRRTTPQIVVRIKDTGVGIAQEDLEKIFLPFYSSKARGFGIGLPTAKEIIEIHHGKISINSQPHHGSTFTITIPYIV